MKRAGASLGATRARQRGALGVVLLGFLCIFESLATDAAVVRLSHESGEASLIAHDIELDRPEVRSSLVIDCEEARSGRCALRTEVLTVPGFVTHGAYRAEAHTLRNRSIGYCRSVQTSIEFSFKVAAGVRATAPNMITSIWQFKRTSTAPDAFFAIRDDKLIFRSGVSEAWVLLDPLPRNVWLDVKMKVEWSERSDGVFNIDLYNQMGVLAASLRWKGATLRNPVGGYGYMKWGQYKPNWIDVPGVPSVIWFDDISISTAPRCD